MGSEIDLGRSVGELRRGTKRDMDLCRSHARIGTHTLARRKAQRPPRARRFEANRTARAFETRSSAANPSPSPKRWTEAESEREKETRRRALIESAFFFSFWALVPF